MPVNSKPALHLSWLKAGLEDFRDARGISLIYGVFVFLVSMFVAFLAWKLGGFVLLFSALSGFVFVAPLLAFGLVFSEQAALRRQEAGPGGHHSGDQAAIG